MLKTAAAKFSSQCSACGLFIRPGDMITYDPAVKYSSRHKVCSSTVVKSSVPLNSPGRAALQGRGRSDSFLGEKTDICLTFLSRGPESSLGDTIRAKDGRYLTSVGAASHYVSQNEADDFDLIGMDGSFSAHWSLMRYYRLATEEEAAPIKAREEEAARKKVEAERTNAEVEQARKDFDARLTELTAGLYRCECAWEFIERPGKDSTILDWHEGSNYKSLVRTASKVTGVTCYTHPHGGYDDYRLDAYVDAATRDAINRAWTESTKMTVEKATDWLAKYRGCVGTESYEWAVANL